MCVVAVLLLAGATLGADGESSPGNETATRSTNEASQRPNIFLLNIDMLRADHVGLYGYPRATTPVIDRLGREGVWFSAARSHAPWTYPSVVSLLSGVHPSSHGATYSESGDTYVTTTVPSQLPTLATLLQAAGYSTAAFITNPLLKKSSGLDRGFDDFRDEFVGTWKRHSAAPWSRSSMSAENVHRTVLEWLDARPAEPLFAYIHYIDVHGPYLTPKPFGRPEGSVDSATAEKARLSGIPRQLAIDLYDGELLHLDRLIGDFVAALDERGVLANSVVVITADHGEEFGEHGGHGHGHSLFEEMLHVPFLILRTEAMPYSRRIDMPVAQIDILPTLAEIAEVDVPTSVAGRSLLSTIRATDPPSPRPILSEMDNRGRPVWNAKKGDPLISYSVLVPPATKYVLGSQTPLTADWTSRTDFQETIFDLAQDSGEETPVAPDETTIRELRRDLDGLLRRARSVAVTPGTATLDEETQARLRALGYLPAVDETPPPQAGPERTSP